MSIQQEKQFHKAIIAALAGIFALASFALAILGVNIYGTVSTDTDRQNMNEAASYVIDELRQAEDTSRIRIATLSGSIPSIVITTHEDDGDKELWLFAYDGYLREISADAGTKITPAYGKEKVPVQSVDFEIIGQDLLEITTTSGSGGTATVNLELPGIGGADE